MWRKSIFGKRECRSVKATAAASTTLLLPAQMIGCGSILGSRSRKAALIPPLLHASTLESQRQQRSLHSTQSQIRLAQITRSLGTTRHHHQQQHAGRRSLQLTQSPIKSVRAIRSPQRTTPRTSQQHRGQHQGEECSSHLVGAPHRLRRSVLN